MKKISILEARRTTTMFPIDNDIESSFNKLVNKLVDEMINNINGIDTIAGLEKYIRENTNSIDNLIVLLGISKEKFKRVVSLIRLKKGFTFESEWEASTLRTEMIKNPKLMSEFCDLFKNGYASPKLKNEIPSFILNDFRIDGSVLKRLQNRDYLTKLIKSKVVTDYNGKCSSSYLNNVRKTIKSIAASKGLEFEKIEQISNTNIKDVEAICFDTKYILINIHFSLTTSSGQTSYYKDTIQPLWDETGRNSNLLMVNILDGAGWIGRPSDYNKIYFSCNYFLNLQNISLLNKIINEFYNIF